MSETSHFPGVPDGGTLKVCGKTEIREHPGAFKVQKEVRLLEPRKGGRVVAQAMGDGRGGASWDLGGLVKILGFALKGTGTE